MHSPICNSRLSEIIKIWCLGLGLISCLLLYTANAKSAEASLSLDNKIATLVQKLGADKATNKTTLGKLRSLIAQRQANPAAIHSNELQEGLWIGVIEKVYVDTVDVQGNIVSGDVQMYLHTGPEHLQVYFLDDNLDQKATGQRVTISGYRSGKRVIVPDKPISQFMQLPKLMRGEILQAK